MRQGGWSDAAAVDFTSLIARAVSIRAGQRSNRDGGADGWLNTPANAVLNSSAAIEAAGKLVRGGWKG